jgi:hypothetical protein
MFSSTVGPIVSLGAGFPLQKSEQPDLALWLHASFRRQLKEGARDPFSIAFEALKALAERSDGGTQSASES